MKKKGMTIGHIVAIILGIALLVFILISILSMKTTGESFIDKIKNLFKF